MPPPPPDPELALVPPEPALEPPELALVPPELPLTPPELVLEPPEPAPVPPELPLTPPELALVPPELELVPPVLPPLDPAAASPVPAPPLVAPFELDPLEQPPAAANAMIAAPARNAGQVPETTEREVRVVNVAKFMRELYYVHARGLGLIRSGGQVDYAVARDSRAASVAFAFANMLSNRSMPMFMR
jgi:hypothetical protein